MASRHDLHAATHAGHSRRMYFSRFWTQVEPRTLVRSERCRSICNTRTTCKSFGAGR